MKNKHLQGLLAAIDPASPATGAEVENLDRQLLAKLKGGIVDSIDDTTYPPKPTTPDHGCAPGA